MARSRSKSRNSKKRHRGRKKGTKGISQSLRAGLTFPVGRIGRYPRRGLFSERVGKGGPIFAAAVIEYLTAELLELAGNVCVQNKRKLITPRHIVLAVQQDEELSKLLRNNIYHAGGVAPAGIHECLLKLRTKNTFKGHNS